MAACKYRESSVNDHFSGSLIFCLEIPFSELFSKNISTSFSDSYFLGNLRKFENAVFVQFSLRHIVQNLPREPSNGEVLKLLQLTPNLIRHKNNHETLKTSLPYSFDEVNGLIDKGTINVDGQDIQLEFFLGGDMKFILMIMGINSATGDYACLWCKIHKDDRWIQGDHSAITMKFLSGGRWKRLSKCATAITTLDA